jgi:hypothetical protein
MYDLYEKNSNKIESIENEKKNLINGGKGGIKSFFSFKSKEDNINNLEKEKLKIEEINENIHIIMKIATFKMENEIEKYKNEKIKLYYMKIKQFVITQKNNNNYLDILWNIIKDDQNIKKYLFEDKINDNNDNKIHDFFGVENDNEKENKNKIICNNLFGENYNNNNENNYVENSNNETDENKNNNIKEENENIQNKFNNIFGYVNNDINNENKNNDNDYNNLNNEYENKNENNEYENKNNYKNTNLFGDNNENNINNENEQNQNDLNNYNDYNENNNNYKNTNLFGDNNENDNNKIDNENNIIENEQNNNNLVEKIFGNN